MRTENQYLGAARNTGAQFARGQYIVFMDDDNYAKPHEVSYTFSPSISQSCLKARVLGLAKWEFIGPDLYRFQHL